jgi:hypothetical protein
MLWVIDSSQNPHESLTCLTFRGGSFGLRLFDDSSVKFGIPAKSNLLSKALNPF